MLAIKLLLVVFTVDGSFKLWPLGDLTSGGRGLRHLAFSALLVDSSSQKLLSLRYEGGWLGRVLKYSSYVVFIISGLRRRSAAWRVAQVQVSGVQKTSLFKLRHGERDGWGGHVIALSN